MSSLQSQADKDKEAMKEDYQKALEVIFSYSYECCICKHNICGSRPEAPDDMPDSLDPLLSEFFVDPRYPSISAVTEATTTEVDLIETTKDPEENASIGFQS